jgi:hypothetical protein
MLMFVGFALLLAACSNQRAACDDGTCRKEFTVQLVGDEIPDRFVIEVQGDGQEITAICQEGDIVGEVQAPLNTLVTATCDETSITFITDPRRGFSPRDVDIHVRTSAGERVTSLSPDYETVQGEGLFCARACQSATLSAEIP